ncbi:C40 family peptidase [Crocosphaera chwakensis]|uniref:NLP/P60 n=1 Tax=Crocosphaera chwakensis CCY0110 TaxID=391612 RepID=A3IN33_9CHRO|nr:C40 family peptidase [Crocosphaera chwakensis]EAZ92010.1 NLP/P60 [Crocosphaera chwakensis CCY0110]
MLVLSSPATSLDLLPPSISGEYRCRISLNLYNSATGKELATQVATGRHLKLLEATLTNQFIRVQLCEDGYLAWLSLSDLQTLDSAKENYQFQKISRRKIERKIPNIIAFTKAAMKQPNYYLWGGTIAPNYDCSGLMQAAFCASGIWLPRDSYQQQAFVKKISYEELLPGDLIFFATTRVDHVALYLGNGYYIHSSGQEVGRNKIAIDHLCDRGDKVSTYYYQKIYSFGRVMESYYP